MFPGHQSHRIQGSKNIPSGVTIGRRFVYVVENPVTGLVKIGIAQCPKVRIQNLETGCGCRFASIFISKPLDNAESLEVEFHELFRETRALGEWFREGWGTIVEQVERRLRGEEYSPEYWHPHYRKQVTAA